VEEVAVVAEVLGVVAARDDRLHLGGLLGDGAGDPFAHGARADDGEAPRLAASTSRSMGRSLNSRTLRRDRSHARISGPVRARSAVMVGSVMVGSVIRA
jgi:hypothetical protein